jgi:Flp pilus assembly protein TadG
MKKIKSERGQSLVELAISLVIILFLLAGAVEFGIALFQFIQLRDAAQEGALYGSICPHDPDVNDKIKQRVRAASDTPLDLSIASGANAVNIIVEGRNETTADFKAWNLLTSGDGVFVEASYDHVIFMPFASLFMDSPLTIRASVTDTILDTDLSKVECQ